MKAIVFDQPGDESVLRLGEVPAPEQMFPAENDLARTRRDQLLALVALYRALGGGWNTQPPEPSVPQPIAP